MATKKKTFDVKNISIWAGCIVGGGIILTGLTKVVDFLRIPDAVAAEGKRIDKLEEATSSIAEVLKEQKTINDYVQKQDAKQRKEDDEKPILSEDGKHYWDKDAKKWKKVVKDE